MEKTTYSFTNFNATAPKATEGTTATRKPTERQIQYYLDLCIQRKVTPVNYIKMSYDEVAELIEELKKFYPASEKQIQMIKDKLESLNNMGVAINAPNYATLTGGREGTASTLIESLINMEKQFSDKMPPTDSQLQFMVSMYLCPDVDFEKFNIQKRVDMGNEQWRKLTPDEFAEEIKAKMCKRDASKFIDDYRGSFHTWKQTRIRPEQMTYIRKLESRMMNLEPTSAIEWAINEDGDLVQVASSSKSGQRYNPTGYVPVDEMELLMFSVDEASKYIDILKSEYARKDLYKFGEQSDESLTFEEIRTAHTKADAEDNELQALNDLMFRLEAVAGYADEELHNAVTSLLLEDDVPSETVANQRAKIKEFMLDLIKHDDISFEGVADLCKESKIAQKILLGC